MGAGALIATKVFGFAVGSFAAISTGILIDIAITYTLNAITNKGRKVDIRSDASARKAMFKASINPRRVIYGQVRVSGPIVFEENTDDNTIKHIVVALASHECEEIGTVYFDDVPVSVDPVEGEVTTSTYRKEIETEGTSPLVWVRKHLGTDDQLADSMLVSEVGKWTDNHRLQGIAYIYIKWVADPEVGATHNVPTVTVDVKGRKVWDIRSGSRAWSDNAALCLWDYLADDGGDPNGSATGWRFGLQIPTDELNTSAFSEAANICAETVGTTMGPVDRYTCNGVAVTGRSAEDVIGELLSACAGNLIFTGGQFHLRPGVWRTPVLSIGEDNFRGPVSVATKFSRRNRSNSVRGVYVGPDEAGEAADFPSYTDPTYFTQDGNELLWLDVQLPFTDKHPAAQRIARQFLHRSRDEVVVEVFCDLTALDIVAGENLRLSFSKYGWSNKTFEVIDWNLGSNENGEVGVNLVLQETNASIFAWDVSDELAHSTPLQEQFGNPFLSSPPENVDINMEFSFNETVIDPGMRYTWDHPSDGTIVDRYELEIARTIDKNGDPVVEEYRLIGSPNWPTTRFLHPGINWSSTYKARIRTVNWNNVRSDWVEILEIDNTSIEPPFVCFPPVFAFVERELPEFREDGGIRSILIINWEPDPLDQFVVGVEIQWKYTEQTDEEYVDLITLNSDNPVYAWRDVDPDRTYDFRIRCFNSLGIFSPWIFVAENPLGAFDPLNVNGFAMVNEQRWRDGITLRWDPSPTELNISHYEIRRGLGAWEIAAPWVETDATEAHLDFEEIDDRRQSFFIKAFTRSGTESTAARNVDVTNTKPNDSFSRSTSGYRGTGRLLFDDIEAGGSVYRLHASTSQGFSPNDGNLLLASERGPIQFQAPDDLLDKNVWLKLRLKDELAEKFGENWVTTNSIPIYIPPIDSSLICRDGASGCVEMTGIIEGIGDDGEYLQRGALFDMVNVGNAGAIQNPGRVLTGSDNGSSAKIAISAHSLIFPDGVSVNYNSGNISGLQFNKVYYVYKDDPNFNGGGGYSATLNRGTVTSVFGRYLVGTVLTPEDGGGDTGGGGGGGGGGIPPIEV